MTSLLIKSKKGNGLPQISLLNSQKFWRRVSGISPSYPTFIPESALQYKKAFTPMDF